jgi:crotonobetainyl-CoA:carnitine CoA-transferase CaiB-like acyl-CoA transferase
VRTAPVDFGASTADILAELGYTDNEIKAFSEEGVV